MKISDDRTVKDLQEEFSSEFPFLRIDFYKHGLKPGEKPSSVPMIDKHSFIGQIRNRHNAGYIKLEGNLTAHGLQKIFGDIFGLYPVVSRKTFGQWKVVEPSDSWTLKELNLRGFHTEQRFIIL